MVLIVDVSGLPLLIDGWVTCPCPIEPERISVWGEPPHGRLGEARLRADWFKFGNVREAGRWLSSQSSRARSAST